MKKFSSDFSNYDFSFLDSNLFILIAQLSKFCFVRGIPLHFTSCIRPIYDGFSDSSTHQQGRGIDIRIKHWTKDQTEKVLDFLRQYDARYEVGAISKKDGLRRLAVLEKDHLHLQVGILHHEDNKFFLV